VAATIAFSSTDSRFRKFITFGKCPPDFQETIGTIFFVIFYLQKGTSKYTLFHKTLNID
jgi:hypothetical protein